MINLNIKTKSDLTISEIFEFTSLAVIKGQEVIESRGRKFKVISDCDEKGCTYTIEEIKS
jgi:hypothetical protein